MTIRLGHPFSDLRPSLSNGPGWRINLWTQGCSLRCTETCLNPSLLDAQGGFEFPAGDVAEAVVSAAVSAAPQTPVEGVTVLGGEPTDQMAAVTALLERVRRAGLTTMVYTGLTLDALRARGTPEINRFLDAIDLLVDGPYVAALRDERLVWRGSANQHIHCLSGRYTPDVLEAAFAQQGKAFSILVSPSGMVSVSGIQDRKSARRIEAWLGRAATLDCEQGAENESAPERTTGAAQCGH